MVERDASASGGMDGPRGNCARGGERGATHTQMQAVTDTFDSSEPGGGKQEVGHDKQDKKEEAGTGNAEGAGPGQLVQKQMVQTTVKASSSSSTITKPSSTWEALLRMLGINERMTVLTPDSSVALSVLYTFAGPERRCSLGNSMKELCMEAGIKLTMVEVDIMRAENQDLSSMGPPPLRSFTYPEGFPWLKGNQWEAINTAYRLIDFTFDLFRCARGKAVRLSEFPEDLGAHKRGIPASIWQERRWQSLGMKTFAFHEGNMGAASPKPTRCLADCEAIPSWAKGGWPRFGPQRRYLGPLDGPPSGLSSLEKRPGEAGFRTGAAAPYPQEVCEAFAAVLIES